MAFRVTVRPGSRKRETDARLCGWLTEHRILQPVTVETAAGYNRMLLKPASRHCAAMAVAGVLEPILVTGDDVVLEIERPPWGRTHVSAKRYDDQRVRNALQLAVDNFSVLDQRPGHRGCKLSCRANPARVLPGLGKEA